MNTYFYPAVFHSAEEGGYWVSFPDFPECFTQGSDTAEAYKMANEALGLCIEERIQNNEQLPTASTPMDICVPVGDFNCLIEFDFERYRREHNSRAVKKTLTIPEWLNEAATAHNINFSKVLQEALVRELGIYS